MAGGGKKKLRYRRVLLKVSGEGFCGEGESGVSVKEVYTLAGQIQSVSGLGVEVAVVMGGGNIVRGSELEVRDVNRAVADHMGMLSTVVNALILQEALEKLGVETRLLSAVEVAKFTEPFVLRKAVHHLKKGRIVLLAGGTGNPFFTTDTCAALRAIELGCEILLKATKVDGVYSEDPKKVRDATKFDGMSYTDVLNRYLKVMDRTAITLCMENNLPILVFNMNVPGNIEKAVRGEKIGTLIGE